MSPTAFDARLRRIQKIIILIYMVIPCSFTLALNSLAFVKLKPMPMGNYQLAISLIENAAMAFLIIILQVWSVHRFYKIQGTLSGRKSYYSNGQCYIRSANASTITIPVDMQSSVIKKHQPSSFEVNPEDIFMAFSKDGETEKEKKEDKTMERRSIFGSFSVIDSPDIATERVHHRLAPISE